MLGSLISNKYKKLYRLVSKPYRYARKGLLTGIDYAASKFQNLIGMLGRSYVPLVYTRRKEFQNLIGMLGSFSYFAYYLQLFMFQNLIGMLGS